MSASPGGEPEAARADYTPATTTLLAAITRYARSLYRLRRGNDVTVLRDDETFPAMLAAIAAAKRSVVLETYIFEDDASGLKFVSALIERAQAGVDVRLIFDAIGGFGLDSVHVDRMRAAGVKVVEYHPIAPWRARFNLSHRDHRKILVVDDEIAFTGGINLSDDYVPLSSGGRGWYDVHCALRGPVVADLARIFRRTWIAEGGDPYPAPERALARAAARGCEVAVIVPGRSDVRAVEYAGLYIYRWFVQRGIRILRWTGPMMHAKTAVVDGMWSTIGSYNLDARSWRYNLEVIVEIIDADVGAGMEAQFRIDEQTTTPFALETWQSFAWWRKALAWLAFRFRSWL